MYTQQMQHLAEEYPSLYEKLVAGFHAVRRSDRHWSGLWSDLVIEQTLMRSIKTHGGLTRGRGVRKCSSHVDPKSQPYFTSTSSNDGFNQHDSKNI